MRTPSRARRYTPARRWCRPCWQPASAIAFSFATLGAQAEDRQRDPSTFSWHPELSTTGPVVVAVSLILFAYSTLLGWSYYGEKCIEYLFGEAAIRWYRLVFCVLIFAGAMAKLDLVWTFSDVMNGLMAIPNLIGLIGLSGVVTAETRSYFAQRRI